MFGKPPDFVLVPDLRPVDAHVEHSAPTLDQLGVYAKLRLDRFRQTGGRWEIVSFPAVFDADVHLDGLRGLGHAGVCASQARFTVMRNSAFVRTFSSCPRSS